MAPQVYEWTCSICSLCWVLQSTGVDTNISREQCAELLQYPYGVNETYGLVSAQYMLDAFSTMGLPSTQKWVTFDEAFAICALTTGVINPVGMYHFMAIRGVRNSDIWVANSARGYRGIYDDLSRASFNNLGPVSLIYLH